MNQQRGGILQQIASNVIYDNSVSGLTSTEVQSAIDELAVAAATAIERTNVIEIIPSVTETVGKVYNTIANAQAYIDTQTRDTNNRWAIYVGQSSENFTVRSWEKIIGSNGCVLSGNVTASTASTADKFEITVEQAYITGALVIASGEQIMFSNCDCRGGKSGGGNVGTMYGYQTTFSGGVWSNLDTIELYHCYVENILGESWSPLTFNSENCILDSIAVKTGTHYLSQFRTSMNFVVPFNVSFIKCNIDSGNKSINAGDTVTLENCDLNNWTWTVNGGTLNVFGTPNMNVNYVSGTFTNKGDLYDNRTSGLISTNTQAAIDELAATVLSPIWDRTGTVITTSTAGDTVQFDADQYLNFDSGTGDVYIVHDSGANEFQFFNLNGNTQVRADNILTLRGDGGIDMDSGQNAPITLDTASALGANHSGIITLTTGNTVDGNAGDISIIGGTASGTGDDADILFQSRDIASPIPFSQTGTTGLVGFTATAIVDALNEVRAAITSEDTWDRDIVNGYTYLKNAADKVGIGTSTPGYQLEIKAQGTSDEEYILMQGNNIGIMKLGYNGGETILDFDPYGDGNDLVFKRSDAGVDVLKLDNNNLATFAGNILVEGADPTITINGNIAGDPGGTALLVLNADIDGGGEAYIQFQDDDAPSANYGPRYIQCINEDFNLQTVLGAGGTDTGNITILSANVTSTNNTGNVTLRTGNTVDGNAGDILLDTGESSGTGDDGDILFKSRDISASIPFSQTGTTGLVGFTATAIIDALNELKAAAGTVVEAGTSQGQMLFWNNTGSSWDHSETTEIFWDDTSKRLGIGTATPSAPIEVDAYINLDPLLSLVAIGRNAGLGAVTGSTGNTLIGYSAGSVLTTSDHNTLIGNLAGGSVTGSDNNCLGSGAGDGLTTGMDNVFIGRDSGKNTVGASNNVFVGNNTGNSTTGNGNIFIGYQTGLAGTTGSNNIMMGNGIVVGATASNTLNIGNTITGDLTTEQIGIAITTTQDASAQLQIDSTTRGFLPPRMTTVQRNAIATPASGLMVYDTDLNQWMGYNGTSWVILG